MLLRTSTKQYEIYYDESNNIRKLYLEGEQYNIDKDPNQESSPIFVLAGISQMVLPTAENGNTFEHRSKAWPFIPVWRLGLVHVILPH